MMATRLLCFTRFHEIPLRYLQIFESQKADSFEQTLEWYECLARILKNDRRELRVYILVSDQDRPLVLFPTLLSSSGFPSLQYRRLTSLSNYFTSNFLPTLNPDHDQGELAASLCSHLIDLRGEWSVLDINPVSYDGEFVRQMHEHFARAGCIVDKYFRFGNWRQSIDGRSFDEYYSTVPSKTRSTIERKMKTISRGGKLELQVYTDVENLDKALDDYEQVYLNSWKRSEPYMDFIREVATAFARLNIMRLGVLYIDGVPASTQLWFVYNGVASLFKLAYDEKFVHMSVGSILTREMMDHVITHDGVQTVDYLIGDDKYKKDWMSERRERWGMMVYRKGTLLARYQGLVLWLKGLLGGAK
jgi:hypothetical protein